MKPAINMKALKANLRESLLRYRKERPHLSLRAIAKNSGCNRYFLSKIIDENDLTSCLDLSQVLILSQFMTGRTSIKETIEESSSELQDMLGKVFALDYFGPKQVSSKMSQVDLYDSYNYFVLVLASYLHGTKREYVNKILGYRGEQALKKLLRDDIVVEHNSRIRLKEGNEFTVSTEVIKQRIPDYLKYYSLDRCYQQKNFIHIYSEGLTESAVQKIYDLHARFNKEIQSILIEKENQGDVPFFSFACMDRLYDCDEDEEVGEEMLERTEDKDSEASSELAMAVESVR